VDTLLAFIWRRPLNEPMRIPTRIESPRQQVNGIMMESISPEAIGRLRSNFDLFASLDIKKIHAGSRSGILTGSTGAGNGASLGTRMRRRSGLPISAMSPLLISSDPLPSRLQANRCKNKPNYSASFTRKRFIDLFI
jgi:hypothetical protein